MLFHELISARWRGCARSQHHHRKWPHRRCQCDVVPRMVQGDRKQNVGNVPSINLWFLYSVLVAVLRPIAGKVKNKW